MHAAHLSPGPTVVWAAHEPCIPAPTDIACAACHHHAPSARCRWMGKRRVSSPRWSRRRRHCTRTSRGHEGRSRRSPVRNRGPGTHTHTICVVGAGAVWRYGRPVKMTAEIGGK
eukprot:scaffold4716_cov109-Isochrysis_galbana.AAC.4